MQLDISVLSTEKYYSSECYNPQNMPWKEQKRTKYWVRYDRFIDRKLFFSECYNPQNINMK